MKYEIKVNKKVEKVLDKAHRKIQIKFAKFYKHLQNFWTQNFPFEIDTLKNWKLKKLKIMEAKLDKDFRIFFRKDWDIIYILLDAWTHNKLWTW